MDTRSPRVPQQERSRDKLERIFETSVQLLIEGGWDAVTVGEVERRSGVGRSTFYLRFPTRQALVLYTRERILQQVDADQSAAFERARAAEPADLESAVRLAVDAMATIFRDHGPALMRIDRGEEHGAGADAMNVLSAEFRSVVRPVLSDADQSDAAIEFATELAFAALVLEIRPRRTFEAHRKRSWAEFVDDLCLALVGFLRSRVEPAPSH